MAAENVLPPEEMKEVPEHIRKRLSFQLEGAHIQSAVTALVAHVTELFRRLYRDPHLSEEEGRAAASWAEQSWRLQQRWDALEPPEALRPLWHDVSLHMTELNRLLDAVPLLGAWSGDDLVGRMAELQAAFNSRLEQMNSAEHDLLRKEKELKATDRDARRSPDR